MSIPTFQLNTTGNAYYDTFGMYDGQLGFTGSKATRHSTVANHNTLTKNIASNHASEFKEAYEYIEDGNIQGFQNVIDKIQTSEASKQRTFNITDAEIATAIEDAYQAVVGADYDTSIASTKMSSFEAGEASIWSWLTGADTTSGAEYAAQRRGTEVNAQEKAQKDLGVASGIGKTVLNTVGAGLAIGGLAKLGIIKSIGIAIAGLGAGAGLLVGAGVCLAGAAILQFITSGKKA